LSDNIDSKKIINYQDVAFKIVYTKTKINIKTSIYYERKKKLALILVTDVTNFKNITKQRIADKYKTLYFLSIAHDLRTPLNSIININKNLIQTYLHDRLIQGSLKISNISCLFLMKIID
jgi:signal transduction histidine kinase